MGFNCCNLMSHLYLIHLNLSHVSVPLQLRSLIWNIIVDLIWKTALAEPLAKGLSGWGGNSGMSNQLLVPTLCQYSWFVLLFCRLHHPTLRALGVCASQAQHFKFRSTALYKSNPDLIKSKMQDEQSRQDTRLWCSGKHGRLILTNQKFKQENIYLSF